MDDIYIVVSSQDYDRANHKMLWRDLAEKSGKTVIVIDIPADYIISVLANHKNRIYEARQPARRITDNLFVIRPLFFIRPELAPNSLLHCYAKEIWRSIEKIVPNYKEVRANFLIYDARWVRILNQSHSNMRIAYYLYDEVRNNGNDNSINYRRYKLDEYACKNSDIVFTMTKVIRDSRIGYNKNIIVLGNGANMHGSLDCPTRTIDKSAAFIGNFRDWIDNDLLESIIRAMPEVMFCFVGSVEDNMLDFFKKLLNTYQNTLYFGCFSKEDILKIYRMFSCVIIPYKCNAFIKATRPIKIVEAVLAGTPVVTVPIDGYESSEFIRFANNTEEFTKEISSLIDHKSFLGTSEYNDFVSSNTWESKATTIIEAFNRL